MAALSLAGLCQQGFAAGAVSVNALPTGGKVVAGSANIAQSGNTMNINQSSQRAVINWNSFDVGSQATVNFNQPNSQAATLNYVNSTSKSMINGAVNANGQVIFVNNNGVVFGKGAEVNVGGMVATTLNTSSQEFMDGKSTQTYEGVNSSGKIINKGNITGNNINSYIALMAPQVKNTGVITATLSGNNAVALVAGQKVSLTFSNSQLVSVSVDASVINALISNKLLINAGSGQVIIAANAAQDLMGSVIKNTGSISADGISTAGGKVSLVADIVNQNSSVSANSETANAGQVIISGNQVNLNSASKTTATGATSGGQILIGKTSSSTTQNNSQSQVNASVVNVAQGALVDASARNNGNGGSISIWSQVATNVAGIFKANGGAIAGKGGTVDTSSAGKVTYSQGLVVDTTAPHGKTGNWITDPLAIIIDSTAAGILSNALNTTNVTLDATLSACGGIGACTQNATPVITFLADVYSANTLTSLYLNAQGGSININSNVTAGSVYAVAQAINVNGSINTNGGSNSNIYLAGGMINILGNINSNGTNNGNSNNTSSNNLNTVNTTTANNRRNNQNGLNADQNTYTSNGGLINILATGDITVGANSYISANGLNGGSINIVSTSGTTTINGIIDSIGKGFNSIGNGGNIAIVGKTQTDIIAALISSEGLSQGGVINLGQVNNLGNGTILAPPATAPPALSNFVNTVVAAAVGSNNGNNSNNSITSSIVNLDSQTGINAPNGNIVVFGDLISVNNSNLSAVNGTIAIGREGYSSGALAGLTAVSNATLIANKVETSGDHLGTQAITVHANEWLLDPSTVAINATGPTTGGNLTAALATSSTTATTILTSDIVSAINAGTSVNIVANGAITQTSALAFTYNGASAVSFTLDTKSGTAQDITVSAATTQAGSGTINLNYYASGNLNLSSHITSTNGKLNILGQSFYANNTFAGQGNGSNVFAGIASNTVVNFTTRGGYVVLDGTGGTVTGLGTSAIAVSMGTIQNGVAWTNTNLKINTTNDGLAVSSATTGGGNFILNTSRNSADTNGYGAWEPGASQTIDAGGYVLANVRALGPTGLSYTVGGFATSSYISALGDITMNASGTQATASGPAIRIDSPFTSYAGSVNLNATTVTGAQSILLNGAVSGVTGVNLTASGGTNVGVYSYAGGVISSTAGTVNITSNNTSAGVYGVSLVGPITAPKVVITANNSNATGKGVSVTGGITISALNGGVTNTYATAGDALTIQSTVGTAGITGGINVITTAITNNSNGGNVSFISNGDITATAAVSFATANTTTHSQTITYDTRTGNQTSQITTGTFTYNATGATQKVNYIDESNGSPLTVGATTISGYINVDNTCPSCATALTPASTAASITTSAGITVNGALNSGDYIYLNGINNSATANAIALGANTLTITSASSSLAPITIIGNQNTANIGNPGIASTGAISVQSTVAGDILFKSNGDISQSGGVGIVGNGTARAQTITYDTTSGNLKSSITSGALTITGSSTAAINFIEKASGGAIAVAAISVPGYILLDNTYGCTGTGCTPVSGFITSANATTYATSSAEGVQLNGTATSGAYSGAVGVTINGAASGAMNAVISGFAITATTGNVVLNGASSGTWYGVNLNALATASAGAITITGTATGLGAHGVYFNTAGALSATGNITISGTSTQHTGVWLAGKASSLLSISAGGTLSITGTSSTTTGTYYGINVPAGILLSATGNLTLNGTGAIGVNIAAAATQTSTAGAVSITGVSTTGTAVSDTATISSISGVTITGTGNLGVSAGTAGAVSVTGAITNTGAGGVTVTSTGNTATGAITDSGSGGISITGGRTVAAGTATNGTITAVGTLTNTGGGVISLSMAQPTSATGGAIETAAGVTSGNASVSSNVSYGNIGGVMGAVNAATVNSVNYRAYTQGIGVTLKASYTQPYGTAYNSVLAKDWLQNPAYATVTVTGSANFGAPTITAAQAQASLIFAGTIGSASNSNLVQTATNLDGTTNILSTLGNVVTTVGAGNTYTITPKALTITGTQLSSTYNGVSTYETVANAGYTISGLVTNFNTGTVASPVTGSATGDAVSSVTHVIKTGATVLSNTAIAQACATTNCYTDAVSAALGTGLSNYTIAYVSGTFNVSKAALTITQGNSTGTYSGSAQTFTPSYSVSGILGADSVSSLSTNTQTGTNAGSYTGTISGATGTGLSNYTIAYTPGTLTINGIPVYVTAANDTKVYGASITGGAITYNSSGISTNPASSAYSVTGLLAGNSISALTLTSSGGVANAGVGSSPYSIVPSAATISGSGAGNYTVYYNNGVMTITPKPITITANAVSTPIYGTSSALTQSAYTVTGGLVSGDAITSVAIKYGAGTSVPGTVNAGTYVGALVPSGATGTGGFNTTNYTISYAAGSLTVNPLSLTITASAQTGATYGTAYSLGSSAYTQSIVTLPNSDVISSVTLQTNGANLVPGTTNAGSYTITPSAATFSSGIAANYNITYATGALTVGKASLTVTPNAVSTTYNGTTLNNTTYSDAMANYTVAGYKNTDSGSNTPIALTGAMTFTSAGQSTVTNAATYTYAVGTLAGTSTNTNYNIVWANAPNNSYVINKALATVVATKPYDGTTTFAASTLTITGVGSETLSASAGTGLANNANVVGVSSLVTSGYTLGNGTGGTAGLAANYVLPSSTSAVSITPLTLTASISGAAQTKVYDTTSTANLTAGSCSVSPCTAGNGVTLSGSNATSGSYTISGFVAGQGAYITTATGNYINATSGLATPNVTLNAAAVTAGSQANAVKAVIAPSNIVALSNTTLSNYVLPSTAQSATNATITAAALGVSANSYSMFTGGTTPTAVSGVSVTSASPSAPANPSATSLSAQVTGLLGSDSVAVSLPLPAGFTTASGGTYTLTPSIASGITAGNYTITPTTGVLSVVGNRDLVISAGNATYVYGTVTAANLATSATPVVQYCAATSGSCAGSVINLTVATTSTPNIWSATSTTGGIYNFTVSVATPGYSTGGFAKVGSYAATASNNQVIHADTTTVVNTYYVAGTVAVTPLTVTPVNNQTPSKVYDATTALTMTSLTTAGMALAGDVLSMTGTAAYNSKNAGTNVAYTISNLALGSADASNYVLSTSTLAGTNGTITPAPLTVAGLSANSKVYDTTNTATIAAAGQGLVGVLGADTVTISSSGNYSGTFGQTNAANGLTVTPNTSTVGGLTVMTGVTLAGTDSGNYYVAGPSTALTANITPVAVSLTGTRVYNGTTAFAASSLTVTGIVGQTLTLVSGGSATANSANVGVANTLSSTSGLTLANGTSGTTGLASNYTLVGATSVISITPAAITVSAADVTKTYDGTTTASSTPTLVSGTLYANTSNSGTTDTLSGGTYAYTNANVGSANKTVTVSGVLASDGNSGANYAITYLNNTTSTINAKSISVTALAQTKSYGTSDPTLTYTVAGLAPTDSLLVMTGNLLRQGTTAPNVATSVTYEQVGTYPIAIGSLSAGSNYTISSFTPANLTITKYATNALTVTANAQTKVYGTNDPTLTYATTGLPASLTADGLTWTDTAATAVTGSLIRAGYTAPNNSNLTALASSQNVGTYAITNTYGTSPVVSANYNITYVGANLTITAAPLTVSAANKTKSYATNDPTLTLSAPVGLINATVDGVAIADTSSVLTGSLVRAQAGTLAGEQVSTSPYAINQGSVAVTGGNYSLAFTPGTLTITPYAGTITVAAVNSQKGYGSSDPTLTYTVSGLANVTLTNGVVINDTLSPTSFFAGNVTRAAGENMNTYAIGVGSLALNSGAGANYSWTPTNTATFTAATFTINPATLYVIVADNGKFVFQNDPTPLTSVVYSGFVNGDTSTTAAGLVAPTLTRVSAGNNAAGTYAITASGASATNYNIVYQYTQGVTGSVPYGTNSNFYVAGSNDLLIAPSPATAVYGTANANINLGKPTVQTCLSPCATTADIVTLNYTGTSNGVLSYADPAKGSGGVSFTLNTNYDSTTPALRNVDAYTLTPSSITQIANTTGGNNYQSTYGLGSTLSITPAPITITSANVVKTYDGSTSATSVMGASAINLATSTSSTGIYSDVISGGSFAYTSPNACAGNCTVTVSNAAISGTGIVNALPNYTVSYVSNTTSTISKAALTITANAQTKMYGTNDPTLTYTLSGLASSDTMASVMSGSLVRAQAATLAGEQVNTGSGYAILQGSLLANTNYTTTFIPSTLTITPRAIWTGPGAWPGPGAAPVALTVTADTQTKAYGSNDPSLSYTVAGLVSVTLSNGVVINDTAASVFTGGLLRAGTSSPGVATGIASEQVGTYAIANSSSTAPLALNATAQSNYGLAANGFGFTPATLTITPNTATINIVAANKTKSYATNDPTLTYTVNASNGSLVNATVDGILINDTAATVTSGALTRAQYGTLAGEQVTTAGYAITQGSVIASPNYAASTFTPATLTITPYATPITITADAKTKSYATNDPTLTYSVSGLVSGVVVDGVALSDTAASSITGSLLRAGTSAPGVATSAANENVGTYAIAQGSVAPNANYTASYVSANLTITPYATPLTITASNQTMVYGSANLPVLSYGVSGLVNGAVVDGVTLSNTAASVFSGNLSTTATAFNGTAASASNVGNYPISVGSLALNSGQGANYTFSATANFNAATLAVTPAPLTIAVGDNAKFVFQADPSPIASIAYSGFVNGDTASALKAGSTLTAPTLARTSAGNAIAGTYAITASSASASNYSISYQYTQGITAGTPGGTNSNFVIAGPYDALIEAKPTTVMYGTSSVTYTTPVVTYCTVCTAGTPGIVTLTGTSVGNNWTFADNLSVSGGVTFTLASPYSSSAAATRAVGDYVITANSAAPISNAGGASNYNNLYKVNSVLTVTPAPISITTANVTKAYDGLTTSAGAAPITTAGTQTYFGDTLSGGTFTYTTASAGAANKTVTPDLVAIQNASTNVASNYTITYVNNTTSTITPAALTITANTQTKMYGTNDPTLTYTLSGLAASDTASSVITGGALTRAQVASLAGEQVGGYAITQGTLAANTNYTTTFVPSTLTITPRAIWTGPGAWPGPGSTPVALTVTADTQTKAYGSNDPTLSYTVAGLVSVTLSNGVVINDTAASVFTGGLLRAGTSSPGVVTGIASEQVGTYAIANSSSTAPLALNATAQSNYGLAANGFGFTPATLTITPKVAAINVVADNKTKMYATNDPALTFTSSMATGSSLVNSLVDGIQITDTFSNIFTGAITRAQVATLPGEQVGSYAITQGTLASPNYTGINYTAGVLTITPRRAWNPATDGPWTGPGAAPQDLTVVANNQTKSYATNDPSLTYTVTGLASVTLANGLVIADTPATVLTGALTRGLYGTLAGEQVNTTTGYAITQGGLTQNTNYASLSFTGATLTITPYATPLAVVANAKTKTYGTSDPSLTYTVTGLVNGVSVDGVTLIDTVSSALTGNLIRVGTSAPNVATSVASEQVGTYVINQGTVYASNYNISYTSANLSITPYATPLAVVADAKTKVYGTSDPSLTYSVAALPNILNADGLIWTDTVANSMTGGLVRTGTSAPDIATSVASEQVDSYVINQGTLNATNYNLVYTPANLTITPAVVTVTANAATKSYGTADPTLAYSTSGILSGVVVDGVTINDTAAVMSGSLGRVGYGTVAGEQVGTYATTIGGVNAGPNYSTLLVPSTLTITPYAGAITISANNQSMVYGSSNLPSLTYTVGGIPTSFSVDGVTWSDTASNVLTGVLATTATAFNGTTGSASNVGNYLISQGTLTLTAGVGANYATPTFTAGTLSVTPAPLTIAVADNGKFVFQTDAQVQASATQISPVVYSGFVNGDALGSLKTGSTMTAPTVVRAAGALAGTYNITASGAAASNYSITYAYTQSGNTASTFTIAGPYDLLIKAAPSSVVYGTANASITYANPTASYCTTCTGSSSVVNLSGSNSGNVWTFTDGLAIPGGVSFTMASTYDSSNAAQRNVGSYIVLPTSIVPVTTTGAVNYNNIYTAASTLTVTPKPISITTADVTKTYDGLTTTVGGSPMTTGGTALAYTDTLSGGVFSYTTPSAAAGTKVVSSDLVSITQGATNVASNYTVTYVNNTTSTITPAALTITANNQSKMYGTNDPTLTYAVSGLAATDSTASVVTGGALTRANTGLLAGEQVGSYAITQGTLATNSNYTVSFVDGTLSITPRGPWTGPGAWPGPGSAPQGLVVTATANTKAYGSNDPGLAYTVAGLVNVTLANGVVINDTATTVFGSTNVLRAGTSAAGVALSLADEQVASYIINKGTLALQNTNYGSSFAYNSAQFTITPKVVTGASIVAANKTKMYGTNDPTLTFTASAPAGTFVVATVDGIAINDSATNVFTGQLTRAQVNTLAGEQVTSAGYAITQGSVAGSGNYSGFTYTPAVLTITPRQAWNSATDGPWTGPGPAPIALTVTAVPATKQFGAADPAFTYTVTGLASVTLANGVVIADTPANTLSGALARIAGENSGGVYNMTQGSLLQNANYASMIFVPATLTIGPAPQTINNMAIVQEQITQEFIPDYPSDRIKKGDLIFVRDQDHPSEYLQAIEVPSSGAFKFPVPDQIVQELINLSGENVSVAGAPSKFGGYKLLLLPKGTQLFITLENGQPLTSAIQYNAASQALVVPKLSAVTLPLSVKVGLMRGTKLLSEKVLTITK